MILKNNLYICEATHHDIPYLINLLKQLFHIEKDFIFDANKHIQGLKLFLEQDNTHLIIAKFEGDIVAMVSLQTVISTAMGSKAGLIEDFVVHDDYKNLGIGSHLLTYIKQKAKEHKLQRLQLVCDNFNDSAKEFYTKKSFKKSNLWAWYYFME